MCPFTAARWSGVYLVSSKHDGLQPCSSIKYLTMCRWPNSAAKWRRVLPCWPGMFRSQGWLEMKNLSMPKCPLNTASCRAVSLLAFLLVWSQCISRMRNFTTSVWPNAAASWRGVLCSESLHIGSQCFSTVRNFTMSKWPPMAAQWSGVFLFSSKQDGLLPCLSIKYLTTCKWPDQAAQWRGVKPNWPGRFWSQFRSEMKNWTMSKRPSTTARCRAVALVAFLPVGLQCISTVRNFTVSLWPFSAAMWRGVFRL